MITSFTYNADQGASGIPDSEFIRRALDRGLSVFTYYRITSETPITAIFDWETEDVLASYQPQEHNARFLLDGGLNNGMVYVNHWGQFEFQLTIAGRTAEQAAQILAWFIQRLPPIELNDPAIVPIKFWAMTKTGVAHRTRLITTPAWNDIALNYTERTSNGLADVMALRRPEGTGRLMLWHGKPGTGKSYAIRSLARVWRPWCDTHYVVDPEHFFGDADYMLTVILDYASEGTESSPATPSSVTESNKFTLLIMEDADEFLGIDAKRREGQAMSRLLNMGDGLIGQGLNLLLLITTNEPIDKIHQAVQRAGRCLANVEFGQLNECEINDWFLRHHWRPSEIRPNMTLAELYALTRQTKQVKVTTGEKSLGFVRR